MDHLPYVLCTGIKRSFASDWEALYQRFLEADSATLKDYYVFGLTCSGEYWMLQRYMFIAKSVQNEKNTERTNNAPKIIIFKKK